jgi:hypothetical protein
MITDPDSGSDTVPTCFGTLSTVISGTPVGQLQDRFNVSSLRTNNFVGRYACLLERLSTLPCTKANFCFVFDCLYLNELLPVSRTRG